MDLKGRIIYWITQQLSLQPGDQMLDVCCGDGALTNALAGYCQHITGIDLDAEAMEEARSQAPGNVTYLYGDARELGQLTEKGFDKALCFASFQYFEGIQQEKGLLTQLTAQVKPGGQILLADIPWQGAGHAPDPEDNSRHYGDWKSPSHMQELFARMGLKGWQVQRPPGLLTHNRFDFLITKG